MQRFDLFFEIHDIPFFYNFSLPIFLFVGYIVIMAIKFLSNFKTFDLYIIKLLFLTLSFNSLMCHAAPGPGDLNDKFQVGEDQKADSESIQNMQISPAKDPEQLPNAKEEKYLFHSQSMSPRLGLILGSAAESKIDYLIGMNYYFDTFTDGKYEVGIDLISKQIGVANISKKWIYLQNQKFRPHSKLGLELILDPDDGLASFLRKEHYLLAGAIGFEDLLQNPLSLRWDLELAIGLEEYAIRIVFGYSWGF